MKQLSRKTLLVWLTLIVFGLPSAFGQIKGAGSSFAANLYETWGQGVAKGSGVKLSYEPVGSSLGVKAVQDNSVDFGATDRPLPRAHLDTSGLVQFPTAVGGVVFVSNIPGVGGEAIKLDGEILAGIFLGDIKQWNAPALKALNPELNLPALPIIPIYRSEGSGTSFVLTTYLSKINQKFKSTLGVTSNLVASNGRGAKTSTELTKMVREAVGSIGYLDYAYASDLGLPTAQIKNQWGRLVLASRESIQLAMKAADWEKVLIDQDPTFELDFTDAGCPGCYPIASATYILVPIKARPASSVRVLDFFDQALKNGDESANIEGYVPLPSRAKNIIGLAMRRWYIQLEKNGAPKLQRRTESEIQAVFLAAASSSQARSIDEKISVPGR